jgi:hypothetical protein
LVFSFVLTTTYGAGAVENGEMPRAPEIQAFGRVSSHMEGPEIDARQAARRNKVTRF